MAEPLVSADWLAARLGDPRVRVVDATWYAPIDKIDARAQFAEGHVPGAVYLDITDISDKTHRAPHMLPPPAQFAAQVGALGLGSDHHVVVYDRGQYAAHRVWWMFRAFGHEAVSALDGGMIAWRGGGHRIATGAASPTPALFRPRFRPELVRSMAEMLANLDHGTEQVVDARPPARFAGELPEMRPGLLSGHLPGSRNVFYEALLDPETKRFRPPGELRALFAAAAIDTARPMVATCGSGVSACSLALALHLIGRPDVPVYDGSWAEWGLYPENPRVLGRDPPR